MTKTYRLSLETVQQLAKIETDTRNINLALFALLLMLHLIISALMVLLDYFIPSLFIIYLLGLLYLLGYFYVHGKDYYHVFYASYQLVLSETSLAFTQLNKRPVEIENGDIVRIRELLPEGEMYILGRNRKQIIDVYSLLLKDNPELKQALTVGQTPELTNFGSTKLIGPILALAMAFVAVFFCIRVFQFPYMLMIGLLCLEIWVAGLYKVQKWPVIDPRIKKLMWIGVVPAIVCVLLAVTSILWFIAGVFGMA
jgi:hypothetical protein